MESKRRKTSLRDDRPSLEFALFSLNQITECGIILLQQQEHSLIPLFVNNTFCDIFGLNQDIDQFVLEEFIDEVPCRLQRVNLPQQKDIPLFKGYLTESANQSKRIHIWKKRVLDGKESKVLKDAKVACSVFSNDLVCCKFQLNDPSLEDKLKWHEVTTCECCVDWKIAEQQLGIPWGFYRIESENKDICSMYLNEPAKKLRKPCSDESSYYCRSDGAMDEKQFEWWLQELSVVNENNPKHVVVKETNIFGVKQVFRVSHFFLYRDENGYPIVLGTREDVSESMKLQNMLSDKQKHLNELDSANRYLRHFFDLAPLHMGVVKVVDNNTNTMIILANKCHEARVGFPLAGKYGSIIFHVDFVDIQAEFAPEWRVKLWIDRYVQIRGHQEVRHFQDAWDDDQAPGSKRYWSTFIAHLEGDVYAYLAHDVTQTQRLQDELTKHRCDLEEKIKERTKQLECALQVKSRFLATMSHEMRTPLSGSMGAMSLLEETPLTLDQKNLVRIAQVCGGQLLTVINDVLDLSKLEENKLVLEKEPFDIRSTLEESLDMVIFESSKKGLELICAIDPTVPSTVIGDGGRLRQIIVNLLSNAVKFSSKGEIVLRAHARLLSSDNISEITISVQDEGIGIQEEDKHKLFQVFTQLDNSVTRKHYSDVRWFESTPGQGSTFYTSIIAPTLPAPAPDFFTRICSPLKCAIVDRSATFGRHLRMLLENLGNHAYSFSTLESVGEADCLFVDSRFPMKAVRAVSQFKHIVLMSYTTQQSQIPEDCYLLEKPLRESKLSQLMEDIRNHTVKPLLKNIGTSDNELGGFPRNLSILLAEDNEMNQQIITRMLTNLSFTDIKVVGNGKMAVDQVRSGKYDLILMDVMMPEMGGIEATEMIRKEFGEKPIIVALTANAFAEDKARCMEAGMQEVLTKPVQKTELIKMFKLLFSKQNERA